MDGKDLADALASLLTIGSGSGGPITLTVAGMFLLALLVLVAIVVLAGLAGLLKRWLSHELDLIFEFLLLAALVGVLAWMYFGGYFRLM